MLVIDFAAFLSGWCLIIGTRIHRWLKAQSGFTGISSKFALSAAGIHSAPKFFAGFADLTGLGGILTRQRSGKTKIPRAGKNAGLIDRVNVNAALRSVRAGHR